MLSGAAIANGLYRLYVACTTSMLLVQTAFMFFNITERGADFLTAFVFDAADNNVMILRRTSTVATICLGLR